MPFVIHTLPLFLVYLLNLFLPQVPVWFLMMLLAMLADGQLGLIEGGSHEFVRAIEQRYLQLGGRITYKATVNKILVKDDQAVGIRLADGSQHVADAAPRFDDPRLLAAVPQASAQAPYLHIDAAVKWSRFPISAQLQQLVTAQHMVGMIQKHAQKVILPATQWDHHTLG